MERYIGMDVHAASCTLAVISEKGRKLKDFPVETNGQALVEAIRRIPGHKHLVMEEGLQSAWLYEILIPHVDELVVAGITQSRGPKSDKRDAYGLAEKLRVGNLDKHVFKAPRQFTRLREFSRTHVTLVGDVVRTQARIKSVYRSRGVLVTGIDVYSSRRRNEWLEQLPSTTQIRATRLYDHLDFLLEQKKQAEADLLREAKKHPIVATLETAPGFGPIRAARLVPIVITPHRTLPMSAVHTAWVALRFWTHFTLALLRTPTVAIRTMSLDRNLSTWGLVPIADSIAVNFASCSLKMRDCPCLSRVLTTSAIPCLPLHVLVRPSTPPIHSWNRIFMAAGGLAVNPMTTRT